jgi:uncharacterized protein
LSIIFADTSAIAKRYIPESGSIWVKTWADPANGNSVVISELASIEFVSLMARRLREGFISQQEFTLFNKHFSTHLKNEYIVVPLKKRLFNRAKQLLTKHPLRTLDAIQLASALVSAQTLNLTPTFISADRKLLATASAEGFPIDNPYDHP